MPTATHATVTINSIHVIDSSVTTTAEPGSAAEWYMTFIVNGQTAQWSHDGVKDDTVYAVNRQFPNVPLGPNGMVTIQASGYEHDTTSANDTLPTLTKTLHPAQVGRGRVEGFSCQAAGASQGRPAPYRRSCSPARRSPGRATLSHRPPSRSRSARCSGCAGTARSSRSASSNRPERALPASGRPATSSCVSARAGTQQGPSPADRTGEAAA